VNVHLVLIQINLRGYTMYKSIKFLTLISFIFINSISYLDAQDMKVVKGQAKLSEKQAKSFKRHGNNPSKYKDLPYIKAEKKCFKNALLNEYNALLSSEDQEKFLDKLKSEIYPTAEGFITDRMFIAEEIKRTDKETNRVELILTYKVAVDIESFKKSLESIGVSFDIKSRKTVMLLMEEFFKPDYVPSNKGALKKEVTKSEWLKMEEFDKAVISSERGEVVTDKGEAFESKDDVDELYKLDMERRRQKTVKEYFPPDLSGSKRDQSAAGAEIEKYLISKDVNVLDKEYTNKLRNEFLGANGYIADFLTNDDAIAELAKKSSEEYGADILICGMVNIIYDGQRGKGNHAATAQLVVKMVDAGTGQKLGSDQGQESSIGNAAEVAAQRAAAKLGQVLGEPLTEGLINYMKKREERGYEYSIFLNGIGSTKSKVRFLKVLKGLESTVETYERRFDRANKMLEVLVQYKGTTDEFKEAFYEEIYEYDEFGGLEEEQSKGNTIFLKLYE